MSSALFLIAQQNFRDEELLQPKEVLEKAGIICAVASLSKEPAIGKLGATILPDFAVKDVNVDEYDAIVLIGGSGAPELANYPDVMNLIKTFHQKEKLMCAICIAPFLLAKAGVLIGKRATVFRTPESIKSFEDTNAELISDDVVVDGRVITANGPHSAIEFGQRIKEYLLR